MRGGGSQSATNFVMRSHVNPPFSLRRPSAGYSRLMGADEEGTHDTAQDSSPRAARSEDQRHSMAIPFSTDAASIQ
jgi:hypothetical protein